MYELFGNDMETIINELNKILEAQPRRGEMIVANNIFNKKK
jgi:hypothetical protein